HTCETLTLNGTPSERNGMAMATRMNLNHSSNPQMASLNPVMFRKDVLITLIIETLCQKYGSKIIGRGLSAVRYPVKQKHGERSQETPMERSTHSREV
ncbi:MAG: hypothetical protein Q8Q56_02755, partial [Alphaproteobacteria bacterium]|nr:hypothetical protein [Alphaproteobacteria bacterium]